MMDPLGERASQVGSTNHLWTGTLASLPTSGLENGAGAFITNGRKDGEAPGAGTGIPAWFDVASGTWRTYSTGGAASV